MGLVRISVAKALEGMELGSDIISFGKIIARRGDIINKELIDNIKYAGFTYITILIEDSKIEEYAFRTISADDKIRDEEINRLINERFRDQVKKLDAQLNDLLSGTDKIDVDCMLGNIKLITSKADNHYNLFDTIYRMRDFDDSTYMHSLNVSLVATVIAEWVNMSEGDINNVAIAGMLHDIGKTKIPIGILNKPGKLTDDEFEVIKKHPLDGYDIIKGLNLDEGVKLAVLQHHEKCDGTGYPYGLKSSEIHDISKIITIADIYDAMTSSRCYRGPICPFDVMQSFEMDGMGKYDQKILVPFFKGIAQTYLNKYVKMSNGEVGEIVMIHTHDISRPLIKTEDRFIDLSTNRDIKIKKIEL